MPARDCECVLHQGPHWLYMDTVARRANLVHVNDAQTPLALMVYAQEEQHRLHDLWIAMKSAGLADDETIAAYLARCDYAPEVIEALLAEREEVRQDTLAALARLRARVEGKEVD